MLIIIVLAVVLLGGGGAGAYFMFFKSSGEEEAVQPEPGAVVALEAITINLDDGHFLKVSIALQATADAAHEPDGSKALDILISQFSNKSVAELSTQRGARGAEEGAGREDQEGLPRRGVRRLLHRVRHAVAALVVP